MVDEALYLSQTLGALLHHPIISQPTWTTMERYRFVISQPRDETHLPMAPRRRPLTSFGLLAVAGWLGRAFVAPAGPPSRPPARRAAGATVLEVTPTVALPDEAHAVSEKAGAKRWVVNVVVGNVRQVQHFLNIPSLKLTWKWKTTCL